MSSPGEAPITPRKSILRRCTSKTPESSAKLSGGLHDLYEQTKHMSRDEVRDFLASRRARPDVVESSGWLAPLNSLKLPNDVEAEQLKNKKQKAKSKSKKTEEKEEEVEEQPKKARKVHQEAEEQAEVEKRNGKSKKKADKEEEAEEEEEEEPKKVKKGRQGAEEKAGSEKKKRKSDKAAEEEPEAEQPKKAKRVRAEAEKKAEKKKGKSKKETEEEEAAEEETKKSKKVEEEGKATGKAKKAKKTEEEAPQHKSRKEKGKNQCPSASSFAANEDNQQQLLDMLQNHLTDLPPEIRRWMKSQPEEPAKASKSDPGEPQHNGGGQPSGSNLRRSDTSATENGVGVVKVTGLAVKDASGKLKRVKNLSDEQKAAIAECAQASDLDVKERRCLYGALDRRFQQQDIPPALLQKYHEAAGSHSKKFELLKEFLLSDELNSMDMTVYVDKTDIEKNHEVFEEVTLMDLKARYEGTEAGRQFLADLQKSQKGKPNPMKGLSKLDDYKLYKVFKNREHRSGTQSKAGTRIQGQASFQVEDDATKKAVGATLDAMKPLLRNSKGAEKTPKRKGQDENNNNNNGQSKEKSEEDLLKEEVQKDLKALTNLAAKTRTTSQDVRQIKGHEEMSKNLLNKFNWCKKLTDKLETELAEGAKHKAVKQLIDKNRPKLEDLEALVDSAKAVVRSFKSREKKLQKEKEKAENKGSAK